MSDTRPKGPICSACLGGEHIECDPSGTCSCGCGLDYVDGPDVEPVNAPRGTLFTFADRLREARNAAFEEAAAVCKRHADGHRLNARRAGGVELNRLVHDYKADALAEAESEVRALKSKSQGPAEATAAAQSQAPETVALPFRKAEGIPADRDAGATSGSAATPSPARSSDMPATMDAPDGPRCSCGRPSTHESGWCGCCATDELAPTPQDAEIDRLVTTYENCALEGDSDTALRMMREGLKHHLRETCDELREALAQAERERDGAVEQLHAAMLRPAVPHPVRRAWDAAVKRAEANAALARRFAEKLDAWDRGDAVDDDLHAMRDEVFAALGREEKKP